MEVWVVLCKYDGCDDCSEGAHVLGAYTSHDLAVKAAEKHDAEEMPKEHFHYSHTEVEQVQVE